MSEEIATTLNLMVNSWIFKTLVGASTTTLMGWVLLSIRNTSKRIKNAATKDDIKKVKFETFKYTDEQLKIHEDKQILELSSISVKINETHDMVGKLLDIQLGKTK